ncbi:MAG TPA: efflux RND transporter periplasmic adaptor subunit [Burkholderiales bacterium]|nr:efflux RND transporter periplasmic adaptor subunit [Burkholderiales bacterium]
MQAGYFMKASLQLFVMLAVSGGMFGAGAYWSARQHPAQEQAQAAAQAKEREVLRFAPGAPQLSMLKISEAPLMSVPLAEPLNARIAYDEGHTARVGTPVAGRIVELRKQLGDPVSAGEALAVVDSPDLGAAIADAAKARADERRKELALARARELYAGEVLPRKDLESAEADCAQARAETARAALRVANLNPRNSPLAGERMLLSSPVAGVVAERKANPGMEVRPDLPDSLFVVTDLRRLQVAIDLPESVLPKISLRQPVSVEVDAYPGRTFRGRIERISPVVDPALRRIQVRASVENAEGYLRPEMYARVTLLPSEDRNAVRVPNGALVTEGLQHFVFVEREPGVLVRRRIELAQQDREFSYVSEGLARNERVVTSGALLLQSELATGQ